MCFFWGGGHFLNSEHVHDFDMIALVAWLLFTSKNPPKASHQWHWSLVSGIRTHLARQFRPARKAKAAKA